ncbi:DUF4142 domain-containing protein [Cytophagaceae bacterium DM2B3-1]|uniref:DUF4142 domain-containing protein n=1 Tax=Xanthocytophaga flava TaxID=3048013 RepID=A0AAE3QN28_9BACT|nr:DUF4142 domain-containing protein [Xanthocytophaga flavus]MDJ1467871.1 DUF4142 domain-containing protein [Xanthocytophaga flavus]MDJ1479633.1 DUF4142 domain-containing protein [Xanthocytophaga flavus]MDJ1493949.1 DUF4142 domain-containing protein [Xanthocytophaga flavus]
MTNPFATKAGSFIWGLLLTACVTSFSACNNDDDDGSVVTPTTLNTADKGIIDQVAYANRSEIEMGQLALTKSTDSVIRNFAQMMITHHTSAQASLDSVADKYSYSLPTGLDSTSQKMKDSLTAITVDSVFSRKYILGQLDAHTQVRSKLEAYQNGTGQNSDVKAYVSKTLPVVISHQTEADTIISQRGYVQ